MTAGERSGLNVVGIALVSSAFGFILTKLKRDHDTLMFNIFDTINEASIVAMKKVMWYLEISLNRFLKRYFIHFQLLF